MDRATASAHEVDTCAQTNHGYLGPLYGIGISEAYYLPRYGLEWIFIALGLTAFLAGFWVREHWDD